MERHQRLAELILKLANRESTETVFNPYRNEYAIKNLINYFNYFIENPSRFLLVGEAPGYDGCRWTGIPFTSSYVIKNSHHIVFKNTNANYYFEKVVKEPTATIVWEFLNDKSELPLLWNAFPFHPHAKGNAESNRLPNKDEVCEGFEYLKLVIEIFKVSTVCALGRVGEATLKRNFPNIGIKYIRHPSRGGKTQFLVGMEELYSKELLHSSS